MKRNIFLKYLDPFILSYTTDDVEDRSICDEIDSTILTKQIINKLIKTRISRLTDKRAVGKIMPKINDERNN